MTTPAEARALILAYVEAETVNDFSTADLIREKHNCREAKIDAAGDVYIAGPQAGHWLGDEALTETADWLGRTYP